MAFDRESGVSHFVVGRHGTEGTENTKRGEVVARDVEKGKKES
jgi:hypothetical protein